MLIIFFGLVTFYYKEMLLRAEMSAERANALTLEESHYIQAAVELKDREFILTLLGVMQSPCNIRRPYV